MIYRSIIMVVTVFCIGLGPLLPDLPRIPAIWEHFQHHRLVHGEDGLSFVDFLIDHFASNKQHDDEHTTLPFHATHTTVVFDDVANVERVGPLTDCPVRQPHARSSKKPNSTSPSKVWEPPRS